MRYLDTIGRFGRFSGAVLLRAVTLRWSFSRFTNQLSTTATRCFLPVVAVVFPFGMVLALQGLEIFEIYGAQRLMASLASVAIVRELSPVLASVLVAAQGGSAVAGELGAMRTEEEIDATEVMGIDAISHHVTPRVLALTIACPLLNIMGTFSGILGSFITAVYVKGETAGIFLDQLWAYTTPFDIWAALLKTTIFGLIIGLTSAFLGFHARGGAAGVGRAVNAAVVNSVLLFIGANYLLTSAMFGEIS